MNQVAKVEKIDTTEIASITPLELLERARAGGASPDILEKFMALGERWEANQARKAFNSAVAAVKAELKPVARNKTGHNSKKYADFSAIATAVDPLLSANGLGYRFRTEQGERINVTCILFHRDGHSEQTTLAGPPDASGSKNAIQAIGSTLTYLQRYSLVQMLGIAVSEDDNGAAGGTGETISGDQDAKLVALIAETKTDINRFLKWADVPSVSDLPAAKFNDAVAFLNRKKAGAAA